MYYRYITLIIAGLAISGSAKADSLLGIGFFDFELNALSGTTITVNSHSVYTLGTASFFCLDFTECFGTAANACIDATACYTSIIAGDCESQTDVSVSSEFAALGPSSIQWDGYFAVFGSVVQPCTQPLFGWSAALGFDVNFSTDGHVAIEPPDCPTDDGQEDPNARTVIANIYCLSTGPVASSLTRIGGLSKQDCHGTSVNLGAGTYTVRGFTISIDDSYHDVTSDGRFNQDDVDYLISIAPTSNSTYTDRFDFDDSGSVDSDDIAILQCFVDACLDARRIGDADCDNDIDCDDLLLAASQPFAGEDFTGSTYRVGFDVDLDGVNDAADKAALRDLFLAVEPAEYVLDGVLDFFDTSAFMALHSAGDPLADVNGDGVVNFFDVSAYLHYYLNPNCLAPGS